MTSIPRIVGTLLLLALVTRTATAQLAIIGDLTDDRTAAPGQVYEGSITLRNDGSEAAEAKIYLNDYVFSCDGSTRYPEPGTTPRSNASWMTFRPSRVVIQPKGVAVVNYTVAVPGDTAGRPVEGSYWSILMLEEIPAGSPESSLRPAGTRPTMGVRQTIRYGLQIATHLAGGGKRVIEFSNPHLTVTPDSARALQVDLTNTGTLWMRPDVTVQIFDRQGTQVAKATGSKYRIYPGTCVKQTIPLPTIPPGEYKVLLVVDAGEDDAFGAQYTLKF